MGQATFTELHNQAKSYFDLVEAGERVPVLRNGSCNSDTIPTSGIGSCESRGFIFRSPT